MIKIHYEGKQPTVNGRELHAALEVKTAYRDWFPRMCEYGFVEGVDFRSFLSESTGGRPGMDHELALDMAKELCMIQRSDKGRKFRRYFIEVEKRWNSPEAVMARALSLANQQMSFLREQNADLQNTIAVQSQQLSEMQPKASYYDVVLSCPDLLSTTAIAKDYGKSARCLNQELHARGVQFKQGGIWLLYQKYAQEGYTRTKTHTYSAADGRQHSKVHTYWTQKGRLFIYDLLRADGILPLMEQGA